MSICLITSLYFEYQQLSPSHLGEGQDRDVHVDGESAVVQLSWEQLPSVVVIQSQDLAVLNRGGGKIFFFHLLDFFGGIYFAF